MRIGESDSARQLDIEDVAVRHLPLQRCAWPCCGAKVRGSLFPTHDILVTSLLKIVAQRIPGLPAARTSSETLCDTALAGYSGMETLEAEA